MSLTRKTLLRTSKPIARMSAKKAAALAAEGVTPFSTLTPAKPAMRVAASVKRTRPTSTGPDDAAVAKALERDNGCCVRCGLGVSGTRSVAWSLHHRVLRSHGVDNSLPNLVLLCGSGTTGCHGFAHARPALARREGGWILRSTDDPAAFPVLHALYGRVLLTIDGGWIQSGQVAA